MVLNRTLSVLKQRSLCEVCICQSGPVIDLFFRDTLFLILSIVVLFALRWAPLWAWWAPLLLFVAFAAYVAVAVHTDNRANRSKDLEAPTEASLLLPEGKHRARSADIQTREPFSPSSHSEALTPPSRNEARLSLMSYDSAKFKGERGSFLALDTRAGRRLFSAIITESP